ncbi:MAG: YihY family inner membrane protein [Lactobacillaceae bacterium]|jgi:membrane protein|nr:YihY family inner membrane protein [Lactobacillaceae bacterium]
MYLKEKTKSIGLYFAKKLAILIDFSVFLTKRIKTDALTRVAASLSYTSLLAIVPLFAIGLAIFAAFPMFMDAKVQLQEFIINNFLPDMGDEISGYFNDFINASAKLTTIGVVGIAITAVLLLSTIEGTFNFLFKVTKPRPIATKLTLYWTIITLGPLLMGAAFSLRGYITINKFMSDTLGNATLLYFSALIPAMLNTILLVAVFMLVPNRKVTLSNALAGAVTAVILFAVLRSGFASVLFRGTTYKTLYGALATVPILLVWLYTSWAVVLFGAAVTAALEEYRAKEKEKDISAHQQKYNNNRHNNYQRRNNNRPPKKSY